MPDEWIVGVVTEFYRREEHIYITDRKYRLYVHLWCDFFWIRVLIPSVKHTFYSEYKEEMNTRKRARKQYVARIESLVEPFFFLYTLVDYKL